MSIGIYLIGIEGMSYVKIGISVNVEERMKALQTSLPFALVLYAYERTPYAAELEQQLHKRLDDFCVRGEWFDIPIADAMRTFNEFVMMARVDELMADDETEVSNAISFAFQRRPRKADRSAILETLRECRARGMRRDEARNALAEAGVRFDNQLWAAAAPISTPSLGLWGAEKPEEEL